jgi:hypothetical protein
MAGPLNHYAETSERALSVLPSRQQHTRSVHQSCSSINGVALVELEKPTNISCDLAEDGRRRCEGRAGTNAGVFLLRAGQEIPWLARLISRRSPSWNPSAAHIHRSVVLRLRFRGGKGVIAGVSIGPNLYCVFTPGGNFPIKVEMIQTDQT